MYKAFHELPQDEQAKQLSIVRKAIIDYPDQITDYELSEEQIDTLSYVYCVNAIYDKAMIIPLMLHTERSTMTN